MHDDHGGGADGWDEPPDDEPPEAARSRRGSGSAMLAAAMLAVGDVVEPHKTDVQVEAEAADAGNDLPFSLDFGDLPPLGGD